MSSTLAMVTLVSSYVSAVLLAIRVGASSSFGVSETVSNVCFFCKSLFFFLSFFLLFFADWALPPEG